MKSQLLGTGSFLAVALIVAASTSAQEISPGIATGLDALRVGEFEKAAAIFQSALDSKTTDSDAKPNLQFYLGLTHQRHAESLPKNTKNVTALNRQAQAAYLEATRLRPGSASSWNNLGQISARLGDTQAAERAYLKAIDLGTPNQLSILLNYADLLRDQGRFDDATRFYEEALAFDPFNKHVQQELELHYLTRAREKLVPFVWRIFREGHPEWSLETSLRGLETRSKGDLKESEKSEQVSLLTCICRSMAAIKYPPEEIPNQNRLLKLVDNQFLGEGVRELLLVHRRDSQTLVPSSYQWWAKGVEDDAKEHQTGGMPQAGFTELIRTLGRSYETQKNNELAEIYYMLAYELTPNFLDPAALINLADLWIANNQRQRLEDFMDKGETRIFIEKGFAIQHKNLRRTYEIHRALALVYIALNRWGSELEPRSAEFQLRAALDDGEKFNTQARERNSSDRIFDWQLVQSLSTWYDKTRRGPKSFELSVKQSYLMRQEGRIQEATLLFKPLVERTMPDNLPEDTSNVFEKLRSAWDKGEFQTIPRDLNTDQKIPLKTSDGAANLYLRPKSKLPESSINDVQNAIADIVKKPAQPGNASAVKLLPSTSAVDRIRFDGKNGEANVKVDGATVAVPFSIHGEKTTELKSFRYVRP